MQSLQRSIRDPDTLPALEEWLTKDANPDGKSPTYHIRIFYVVCIVLTRGGYHSLIPYRGGGGEEAHF